jgi:hypothetical protein
MAHFGERQINGRNLASRWKAGLLLQPSLFKSDRSGLKTGRYDFLVLHT